MPEPTLKKTHELLEKLVAYVMNEAPTKSEVDKLAAYVMNEVPTKNEIEKRFLQLERELERKAGKEDLFMVKDDLSNVKENVRVILNGMDGMVKSLDIIRTEQAAFISGLRRVEKRVEKLERAN